MMIDAEMYGMMLSAKIVIRPSGGKDDLAPGLLDSGNRRLGGTGNLDRNRRAQFALGQQTDTVAESPQHPRRDERRAVECPIGLQSTTIERRLQASEIHHLE